MPGEVHLLSSGTCTPAPHTTPLQTHYDELRTHSNSFVHQGREEVVYTPHEVNELLNRRDVRHSEVLTEDEVHGPRTPTILLHEKNSWIVRAHAGSEAKRHVFHLTTAKSKGGGDTSSVVRCDVNVMTCQVAYVFDGAVPMAMKENTVMIPSNHRHACTECAGKSWP